MSRSPASDPTLFTSSTPHASSKPTSTIDLSSTKARPGETPLEKVARLRAAAQKAKLDKFRGSRFDQVVEWGRVWADRMHRVTTTGLIGITVLAVGFTIFAAGDMILYNRRRRAEYLRLKTAQRESAVVLAAEARREGRASEDQLALLQEDLERQEAVRLKKERTIFKRIKDSITGGFAKEDVKGGTMGIGVKREATQTPVQGELGVVQAVEDMVDRAKDPARRDSPAMPVVGGPLDQHAAKAAQDVEKVSKSWWGWMSGR